MDMDAPLKYLPLPLVIIFLISMFVLLFTLLPLSAANLKQKDLLRREEDFKRMRESIAEEVRKAIEEKKTP